MPAANAYADTTVPNWAGVTDSEGMISAPRGDISMKSRITANWRNASIPTINF
jgi:hypothetical protein